MAKDIIWRVSLLRRHLSPFTQLTLLAALAVAVGVAIYIWPVIVKNAADQSERARPMCARRMRR